MDDEQKNAATAHDTQKDISPDSVVEAILFSSDTPLRAERIAKVCEIPGVRAVREAVERLNEKYEQAGCAFRIEEIAGGYQMLTLPAYHDVLSRLFQSRKETRLSQAAMETLAIVAYRQPVLRADIEAIRGVACGEVLRGLMEKQLVKIVGRAKVIGRPMLYGTTKHFLQVFGLSSLDDLPNIEEFRRQATGQQGEAEEAEAEEDEAATEESEAAETGADDDEAAEDAGEDDAACEDEQGPEEKE